MKVFLGVVLSGKQKDYCIPKFKQMLEAWYQDVDVVFAVDQHRPEFSEYHQIIVPQMSGSSWATEIVYYGKQALNWHTVDEGYDGLVWQGIDCFYANKLDALQILINPYNVNIYGALVAGRNRPDYAVCREFIKYNNKFTTLQRDISHEVLTAYRLPHVYGYIGSDATFISRDAIEQVSMDGYEHWHTFDRRNHKLGPEEWFMYQAVKNDIAVPLIDTTIRPWHAHETGYTVRYHGEVCDLGDLEFN